MNRNRHGFTLLEAMVATSLAVVCIGAASLAFLFLLKSESIAATQSQLDVDVRRAAERLKVQMRLSALNEMVFFPENAAAHLAVGFPLPADESGDGVLDTDASGRILWHKTVIYHPWPAIRPRELRVTTFHPRDNALSDAERQQQIAHVVHNGDGLGTFNGTNATTTTIFRNLFNWQIRPLGATYDGYHDEVRRDQNVTLGSVPLAAGTHSLKLKIIGRDPAANNYHARLDTLMLTPSYLSQEAENLMVTDHDGAQPVKHFEGNAFWSANHQLFFPADAINQNFTLEFENDIWEKVTFREPGDRHQDVNVVFLETVNPHRFAVQLAGNTTLWEATTQSGSNQTTYAYFDQVGMRILLRGIDMENPGFSNQRAGGARIRFTTPPQPPGMRIVAAWIGESANHATPTPDVVPGTNQRLYFSSEGSLNTHVILDPGQSVLSEICPIEIDPRKSYVISFYARHRVGQSGFNSMVWPSATSTISTYHYINSSESDLMIDTWSGIPDVQEMSQVLLVEALRGTYATEGVYETRIADTRMDGPVYSQLDWDASVPADTALEIKVRSGDAPDLSDAPAWSNVTAIAFSPTFSPDIGTGRYVQLRARLSGNSTGTLTPSFEGFRLRWPGPTRIVDIGGVFTQAPDAGRFEVLINNMQIKTGVIIDLELFRDIRGFQKTGRQRLNSGVAMEVTPRNTRWEPDDA